MPMTVRLRGLTVRQASSAEIAKAAREEGMRTMQQDALQKVLEGKTTVEEMIRVTYSDKSE